MSEKVNEKVAIATDDLDWARAQFDFAWGSSTLAQRLKALEMLVGSQSEVIRLAGLAGSTYKSVVSRGGDMASERIGALAKATNVSLDYLVWGTPVSARDAECEEKRFDIAAREFVIPSSPDRREDRRLLIAQHRIEVEENIALLAGGQLHEPGRTIPAGYVPVPPLTLAGQRLDPAGLAPVALAAAWAQSLGLETASLRCITIVGDEGGREFPPGSIVVIDIDNTRLTPGAVFAVDFGGDPQLRRLVHRLDRGVELRHVNPSWPDESVSSIAAVPVLGRVCFWLAVPFNGATP